MQQGDVATPGSGFFCILSKRKRMETRDGWRRRFTDNERQRSTRVGPYHRDDSWREYGRVARSNDLLPHGRGSVLAGEQSRVQSLPDRGPGLLCGPDSLTADARAVYRPDRQSWAFVPFAHTGPGFAAATMRLQIFLFVFLASVLVVGQVSAHGRLIEPPSRASMWRYGFDTPHDYNDHECYCGGFTRQWQRNKGKCGICGDAWDTPAPRLHETGGKYGNGVIVRKYRTGSVIPVRVELTANHHGYFEFRTCAMTYKGKEVDQECLDRYLLRLNNGSMRYYPGPGNKIFEGFYKLPDDLTCAQCVFQWRYVAGNNWGDCGNGTGAVGCGPQEEFRACADITIGDDVEPLLPTPSAKPPTKSLPGEKSPTEPTWVSEPSGPYWLFSVVIAGTCLLVVLAAIALLYSYYYHSGRAKKWLMARRLLTPESPPVAPPRHRKHNTSNAPLQL